MRRETGVDGCLVGGMGLGEEWVDGWDNGLAGVVMGWERRGMAR